MWLGVNHYTTQQTKVSWNEQVWKYWIPDVHIIFNVESNMAVSIFPDFEGNIFLNKNFSFLCVVTLIKWFCYERTVNGSVPKFVLERS